MVSNDGGKNTESTKISKSKKAGDEITKGQGTRKRGLTRLNEKSNETSKRSRLDISNASVGTILTLGQGDMGQLGLGSEILTRKKPAVVKDLADIGIMKIAAGALHTVCLTEENQIYSFGCNDECALGRETSDEDEEEEHSPKLVGGPLSSHKVSHITAGDSHTMALTSEGKVFIWGMFREQRAADLTFTINNNLLMLIGDCDFAFSCFTTPHGRLGMFSEEETCKVPTLIKSLTERIVSIASGNDHVILVSHHGKVYSMGCSEQGQLGRLARYYVDRKSQRRTPASSDCKCPDYVIEDVLLQPLKVSIPRSRTSTQVVTQAFAGAFASWVLTSDDVVYAWGLNNWNQLGFPDNENRYRPELCPSLSGMNVSHIDGGQHHTVVLDQAGRVFSMGRGEYGRLGLGVHIKQADKLMRIDQLEDITSISTCSAVSFATDNNGVAYGWGLGSNLQLTTGEEDDEWTPVRLTGRNLENRKVYDVSAGGQHTVVLVSSDDTNGQST